MKLSAWREAVSYGAYMQPIHLRVVGSDAEHESPCAVDKMSSQSSQNSHQMSPKSASEFCTETSSSPQPLETSNGPIGTQEIAQEMAKTKGVVEIPPFTSEIISNDEQMVLNVGGPVWAIDWLPSLPAANAEAVAAAIAESNLKKPKRPSAASQAGSKKALNGNEKDKSRVTESVNGEKASGSSDSTEVEGDETMKWRFLALSTHPPCLVEDGKVVKSTPPDHYYDVPEGGRNLIQIWAVPVQRPVVTKAGKLWRTEIDKKKMVKPRIVYVIDHDSGVAWDLQWCPLVNKFPKSDRRKHILGILAVCFGDGSVRIFEIPAILEERLQPKPDTAADCVVEKNAPIVVATVPHIMQLSVQWSPHYWNMLLTGGSDGSVSLWNISSVVQKSDSMGSGHANKEPLEPQRRFQDADAIGKQEALDWGCGWVAVRAVAWSPFDEHIFATTGNDSVFKVWDIREPRACLRSHRIRSTWGLALQWMDQTSIQISGDQGSVYMYDILSGGYQKLHFHPQIDSPVWDLQLARRGTVPLLISSCTSGSIRAAPAKKLYRAPQNCVEICRLSGEKDSSTEKPFKSLTVSFVRHTVLSTADSTGQSTREFCERDAALHRLRLSSSTAGDYPCFLAAGGHAGLVILFELQEVLDTLVTTFFFPAKKINRSKKIFASTGSHHAAKKEEDVAAGDETNGLTGSGRKTRTLGSFAEAGGLHAALGKCMKKPLTYNGKGKAKARSRAKVSKKKPFIDEDDEVEANELDQEEEEPEFKEEDEGDDESELSLVMGDSSDDDRISVSDDDDDDDAAEDVETSATNEDPEDARLMKEYQLNLTEEDAYLLALQMSRADAASSAGGVPETSGGTTAAPTSLTSNAGESIPANPLVQEKLQYTTSSAKAARTAKAKTKPLKTAGKTTAGMKVKPVPPKSGKGKKRARPASFTLETMADPSAAKDASDAHLAANKSSKVQLDGDHVGRASSPSASALTAENRTLVTADVESSAAPAKPSTKRKPPPKALARSKVTKVKSKKARRSEATDQARALQVFEYQLGVCEKDALKEALRLSILEDKHRSLHAEQLAPQLPPEVASGAVPTPIQSKVTPATPRAKKSSQKPQKKVKELNDNVESAGKDADEDVQHQRPQTPRRLQFSPLDDSKSKNRADIVAATMDQGASVAVSGSSQVDAASATVSPKQKPSTTGSSLAVTSASVESLEQKPSAKSSQDDTKTPNKPEGTKQAGSTRAAVSTTTLAGKVSARRSKKSTGARIAGSAAQECTKTPAAPRSRRRSRTAAAPSEFIPEGGDALLLALKMSEIEY
uniref:Uncharacterized protein n=1 Tax=Peronospora matthiolae TaxID=2874970 RepID=A0AAV1T2J7_9STRA